MNVKFYAALSASDLSYHLALMTERKRAEFDAALAMHVAAVTAKVTPVKCKPFKMSDGKFAEREKQVCKGGQSVCRAPHKNQR